MIMRHKDVMMQGFPENPELMHPIGKSSAILLSDFIYIDKAGRTHTSKAGNITDGASIPRFFWRVIGPPMAGPYLPAAIIHDMYCEKAHTLTGKEAKELRLAADKLFFEMLECLGLSRLKCKLMYYGVRIGSVNTR